MYHLIVVACLASTPDTCEPRLLPAAESETEQDCHSRGGAIAADWFARHADLIAKGMPRCLPTQDLPALEITQIADDIYVHLGANEQLSVQNQGRIANLSFVVGETVAVIDAGGSRAEGEALYAAIRRVTDRPISHLVLTHMHPDHIFGAEVFAEAGASILANARLPQAVAARHETWMTSIPAQIGERAMLGTVIAPVDQLLSDPMVIDLGATALTLSPVATAHTDNDLVVFDRNSKVFFSGDLIFQGLTPAIDGSLMGWLDWINAGAPNPQPKLIVPGHGPVQTNWQSAVAPEQRYLEKLNSEIREQIAHGIALSRSVPQTIAALQGLKPGWVDFDNLTARNAATAYAELEWQ